MKKKWVGRISIRLSVALAGLSLIAIPLLPAPALAADSLASRGCATTAISNDNLVYNPSFEYGNLQYLIGSKLGYVNTINTTPGVSPWGVTFWTSLNSPIEVVSSPNVYNTTQTGPSGSSGTTTMVRPSGWPVYDGDNEAALPTFKTTSAGGSPFGGLGSQFANRPALVGTLGIRYPYTTPTVVGLKYLLSARVSNVAFSDWHAAPVAIEMRLRNSATSAESTPVQAIIPNNHNDGNGGHAWGLISGTVTADQVYDKVVIRHYQNTGYAFIDDVVVCRAPTPLHWWQNHGAQAGLALFVLGSAGTLFTWHTHRGKKGKASKSSKASQVAVADFDGDSKTGNFKISDNESPSPMNRILRPGNQLSAGLAVVAVTGAAIFIASTAGGIWKTKTITPDNTPHVTGKLSTPSKKTKSKATSTPATAKTCVAKETVKEGYKLFRSDKYKYCIQYPIKWPVNSTNAAEVTFGTVPDGEPGPGWLKVSYFKSKTIAMRAEEIMVKFREPAGSCKVTNTTLAGESGKKLTCIGAANGENHLFYLVAEKDNLFELSYIGDMATGMMPKTTYSTQYKVMVDSFLCDMFAEQQ